MAQKNKFLVVNGCKENSAKQFSNDNDLEYKLLFTSEMNISRIIKI
jgi:hypothetical protein